MAEARLRHLEGRDTAAEVAVALQDGYALPCPGQVGRGHQAVVPAADDHYIEGL